MERRRRGRMNSWPTIGEVFCRFALSKLLERAFNPHRYCGVKCVRQLRRRSSFRLCPEFRDEGRQHVRQLSHIRGPLQ